jgi:D-sedoheptulose 7-phosphate isomerase
VQLINDYLETVRRALADVDQDALAAAAEVVVRAWEEGRQVFTIGNGASAALASHMACDLGKGSATDLGKGSEPLGGKRLRVISLVDNVALLTAYGNDIAFEDAFVEQLKNLLQPGDVVMAVSGSGGSENVLRALRYARASGAVVVSFTGAQEKAGLIAALSDVCVRAPLTLMEQIEDLHVVFHHVICLVLRQRTFSAAGLPVGSGY